MAGNIISCENVTIKYDSQIAVKNVTFDLELQDYLCIIGENGSGKSTLMKGILGLVNTDSGRITFNGIKQTEIGYMPQQTAIQREFPASVYEVVLSGCLNRQRLLPFYSKADNERAYQNLHRLGIERLIKKSYSELSGGEQQRVLLARALCAAEKLLMLDEPVTGLDPAGTAEMYALLQKINREFGITIIMISHDIENSVKYGNKILHLKTMPLYFGSKEEYLQTTAKKKMLGGEENV